MRLLAVLLLVAAIASPALAADPPPVKVLIIDGQNNHAWQQTTPVLKKLLEGAGRFTVEVATSPPALKLPALPKDATPEQKKDHDAKAAELRKAHKDTFEKFRPELAKYDVVVSNYNGEPWAKPLNDDLDALLKDGKTGLVIVHAANNSFPGWKEYNLMIGMGWRDAKFGDRLKLDDAGKEVRVPRGEDQSSGHRTTGKWSVVVRNAEHPVMRGMPREWMHNNDELYDNMRGPIQNVKVLATAFSKGSGAHEPMIWTVDYGKGRVFHTPMGHDVNAMKCVGFAVTVARGTEWAATGKVTLPIPPDFPTDKDVRLIK